MLELWLHYLDLERIPQRTAHCLSHTNAKLKLNLIITEEHVLQVEESFYQVTYQTHKQGYKIPNPLIKILLLGSRNSKYLFYTNKHPEGGSSVTESKDSS